MIRNSDMSSESKFLESLISQFTLNPKGSIMGKRSVKTPTSSGYQMPWDIKETTPEPVQQVITEVVQNTKPQVSLALKLSVASRRLANLRSEIESR